MLWGLPKQDPPTNRRVVSCEYPLDCILLSHSTDSSGAKSTMTYAVRSVDDDI